MAGEKDITHLYAKVGDRILPKWQGLIQFAEERQRIRFGHGIKVRIIPGSGISVTREDDGRGWPHPWRSGNMRKAPEGQGFDKGIVVRAGTVNGQVPWANKELQLGQRDGNNALALVGVTPKEEGYSWLAIGINVGGNDLERAELSAEPTYDELRVQEIDELPPGFGSGGVQPVDGWAWQPIVKLRWEGGRITKRFQVCYHNMGHRVVAAGDDEDQERHFFYANG